MSAHVQPGWPERIAQVLRKLALTQADLAKRIGVAPSTISRWMKGSHEPTPAAYIALATLAGAPEGAYFLERAGVVSAAVPGNVSGESLASSVRARLSDFKLFSQQTRSGSPAAMNADAVAIPLLNVTAYGDRVPPREQVHLSEARIEEIITVPLQWCPHPSKTMCLHVDGDSMLPLIAPGSIIAVDTEVAPPEELLGRLVLASHRDLGFKIARLRRLPSADILVSSNQRYVPIDITADSDWKLFGQVLWWISKDSQP